MRAILRPISAGHSDRHTGGTAPIGVWRRPRRALSGGRNCGYFDPAAQEGAPGLAVRNSRNFDPPRDTRPSRPDRGEFAPQAAIQLPSPCHCPSLPSTATPCPRRDPLPHRRNSTHRPRQFQGCINIRKDVGLEFPATSLRHSGASVSARHRILWGASRRSVVTTLRIDQMSIQVAGRP